MSGVSEEGKSGGEEVRGGEERAFAEGKIRWRVTNKAAKIVSCKTTAQNQPRLSAKEIAGKAGKFTHNCRVKLAANAPMQNVPTVTSRVRPPEPTVYKVPQPQAPPSCIPIPNTKAPIAP